MKKFVETESNGRLTVDQRNLLSVAYKNVIGTRRNSWRGLKIMGNKEFDEAILNKFKEQIGAELDKICEDVFVRQMYNLC